MDDLFDSLRGAGDRAVLPEAAAVRARGRQRTVRTRALYAVTTAAVLVGGVTVGVALAGGGTSRAVIVPTTQTPTLEPTPTVSPTQLPVQPTATHAPAPPAVCAGVADCHLEATTDMDGDGVLDTVAIVGHPNKLQYGGESWTTQRPVLRVRTATAIATYRISYQGPVFGHFVKGAARLDATRGTELLLSWADGAHGKQESVLTLHAGVLQVLAAPEPYNPSDRREGSWGEDTSWYGGIGWACVSPGLVEERSYSTPDSAPATHFTFTRKQWRRSGASWHLVKTVVTHGGAPGSTKVAYYSGYHGCGTFVAERPYAG
jgi:hypothetical protein